MQNHPSNRRFSAALFLLITFVQAAEIVEMAPMLERRSYHSATLLLNGKVLIGAGATMDGSATFGFGPILNTAEVYDVAGNTWSSTNNTMIDYHFWQTVSLLANGKVLYASGAIALGAELYDPATNSWKSTTPFAEERWSHTATLLPNGHVLICGGDSGNNSNNVPHATADVYDPVSETWTPIQPMGEARVQHTATLLPDGTVLVAGGYSGASILNSAELYDPGTGLWTPVQPMSTPRWGHTATLLPNGKVLVVGIRGQTFTLGDVTSELYDPATRSWTPTQRQMTYKRFRHTTSLLSNGRVVILGGRAPYTLDHVTIVEFYDYQHDSWSWQKDLSFEGDAHTATVLAGNRILITGGYQGPTLTSVNSAKMYMDIVPGSPGTFSSISSGSPAPAASSPPQFVSPPSASPNPAAAHQQITFQSAASDPDGDAISYLWDFGDGSKATGASVNHAYALAGTYTASLTISDTQNSVTANVSVTVESDVIGAAPADTTASFSVTGTAHGSVSLNAMIQLDPAHVLPTGNYMTVSLGNLFTREFVFSKRGVAVADNARARLQLVKSSDGTLLARISMKAKTLLPNNYLLAAPTADAANSPPSILVDVLFNGIPYKAYVPQSNGPSGKAQRFSFDTKR